MRPRSLSLVLLLQVKRLSFRLRSAILPPLFIYYVQGSNAYSPYPCVRISCSLPHRSMVSCHSPNHGLLLRYCSMNLDPENWSQRSLSITFLTEPLPNFSPEPLSLTFALLHPNGTPIFFCGSRFLELFFCVRTDLFLPRIPVRRTSNCYAAEG